MQVSVAVSRSSKHGTEYSLSVDHHQRLAFAAPKDARIVESRNVDIRSEFAFAPLCRCRRHTESDGSTHTSHTTRWSYVVKIIRCACFLANPGIDTIAHITDIGLAKNVCLMVPIRHDSADDEILVLRPIRKRYDGRVPEDSSIRA